MSHHLKYLKYVLRHKWFVLLASIRIGAPVWRAIVHDISKFRPSEWKPYAEYFYKDNKGEGFCAIGLFGLAELAPFGFYVKDRFNIAWLHHQKRNKHHWQYWVLSEDSGAVFPLPIPKQYMLEMVADWMGAGRAITGKWETKEWYEKNSGNIILAPSTRTNVEQILNGGISR